MTNEFDPSDIVVEGLTAAAESAEDVSLGKDGAGLYAEVRQVLDVELRADDQGVVAFACINMSSRTPAFLLVLKDRAFLAWSKGMFRPKTTIESLSLGKVTQATVASGTGANRDATFLTVVSPGNEPWVLALPSKSGQFAELVRSSFVTS